MRITRVALSIVPALLLAAASTALAAPPMVAGPMWAGVDHSLSCKIYNPSTKTYTVSIEMVAVESNTVMESSGPITLAPGGYTFIFRQGASSQVLCRFTGTTPNKSAATMTVYPSMGGDGTDTVVVPAH
jgi:hypothetical protein